MANKEPVVQWAKGLHSVIYNSQIVSLDETKDRFIFFEPDQGKFIESIIHKSPNHLTSKDREFISELTECGILSIEERNPGKPFADVKNSLGAFTCEWRNGDDSWRLGDLTPTLFIKAFIYLKRAKTLTEAGKLSELLNDLRASSAHQKKTSQRRLVKIGNNINFAIKLLSVEVKCLEFAYSLSRIAFEESLRCSFNIGVQTHPFISHAWTEGPYGVILDKAELPQDLAIIVSIGATG
ncbi:lasso peptide biosynthesis B2 protein [Pseudomonas sp. NPDC087814]|jgi:hypothetical protein|uniref:lasso peptide biosynthesis B2 protein n=1 Tax=unclassified Pseudomonas TaxID=196821 RepID=UPI0015A1FBFC|nr:lasso peptide biosynthesis B2 protein [Pseudomonas sp. E6002]NWB44412.1 lasso peptide biosynthesis B2 protein [Pseudomonas sp. E6002]